MTRRSPFTLFVALLVFCVAVSLWAQGDANPKPDLAALAVNIIGALTAPLTVLIVWGAKAALQKIPRGMVPLLAVVIGMGVDYALSYVSSHPFSPVAAAAAGMAATWIREAVKTWQTNGSQPAPPTF